MKNNIKYKLLVVALLFVFSGVVGIKNVLAVGKKFAVSPMNQRVVLIPGETYHGAITVAVPSDTVEEFNYLVSLAPYSLADNETSDSNLGGSDFETVTNNNQIVSWMTIDNPEGTIQPNEQKTVSFTINVPYDAPGGGQYAALLVRENDSTEPEDDQMAIKEVMQMAHIIYAEVAGETREEGEILENSIPSFLLTNKLQASSIVKNNGNIHTDAEYRLQVWPMFGDEELFTNVEDPEKIMVLPGTSKYHNQEYDLPAIGIFRVKQEVKIFGEISTVEKTIIVCPLWLLFIVVFAIVSIIIWLVIKAKSRKK
ncbi:hypothetical protein IJH26_01425 [Candidatus Saccharibacteria bacterium]|nr:hypothetical protein [Candidatus Saccharibacteria bacterium]